MPSKFQFNDSRRVRRALDIESAIAGLEVFRDLSQLRISGAKSKCSDRRHVLNSLKTNLFVQNTASLLVDQNYRDFRFILATRRAPLAKRNWEEMLTATLAANRWTAVD